MNLSAKILSVFLLFFLIFNPKISFLYEGIVFSGVISTFIILINQKARVYFKNIIRFNYFRNIILFLIFIIIVSMLISLIHGTGDYSILKTILHQIIAAISVVLVMSTILSFTNDIRIFYHLIFYVFLVQSISILIAFIVPWYHDFVVSFSGYEGDILDYRGGIRTYAISSTKFFGLGATYGLIYILAIDLLFRFGWPKRFVFVFFFLVVGTLFIARTGLVGLLFALVYLILRPSRFSKKVKGLMKIFVGFILITGLVYILLPSNIKQKVETNLFAFAFEMFMNDDELRTTSTDTLIDMYDVDIDMNTYLWGDGRYESVIGEGYYKGVDAGYLRNIFFGGVPFFIILFFYQSYMIYNPLKKNKQDKFLFYTLIFYTLILHFKGDPLGVLIIYQIVLLLYFIPIKLIDNLD